MASEYDHINLANRNHFTLSVLLQDPLQHAEWIATVAFYKAVHVIEAVFSHETSSHSFNHDNRLAALKVPKYRPLFESFRPLYGASLIARYREDSGAARLDNRPTKRFSTFSSFMKAEKVIDFLVLGRLQPLEEQACQFLSDESRHRLLKVSSSSLKFPD
jgi:hypothetical protein